MDRTPHQKQIFVSLVILLSFPSNQSYAEVDPIEVGVILDMGSSVGKVIRSCITMAVSDFYSLNPHYKTRIVLHLEDSKGQPQHVLSAALNLLEQTKVQAIIGPETPLGSKNLADQLRSKIKVPILSFTSSSNQNPNFIQITQDGTNQFKGIAAVVDSFPWRNVILIFEDTDNGGEILQYTNNFKDFHVTYISLIPPSASSDQILEEIYKFKTTQSTTFVVHMSPSLTSCLFVHVKLLGMMTKGYAWIVTDMTMNLLHSIGSSVIETMEGALGFKSYIPPSSELRNFSKRWRENFLMEEPNMEVMDLNVFGIWAYDATVGLAKALERANNIKDFQSGSSTLLNELTQLRINGLSGDFQIVDGKLVSKALEIMNVLGKTGRRVGFWTLKEGIIKEMDRQGNFEYSSPKRGLKAMIWPGGSTTTHRFPRTKVTKLRIGVVVNSGFPELVNVTIDPQTKEETFSGFCLDVFKAAIAESEYYDVPCELIKVEPQSYNDLIYQVYRQNIDGVVGDVSITAYRSQYVDFTLPYTDVGVGTLARIIANNNDMWVFLKPLDSKLWLVSACFIVLTGFVVWVIEHPRNEEFQGSAFQQIANVFLFSFSTIVATHSNSGRLLSNLSRVIVIVWVFVVLILTSSYTATLSSLLTVQQIQLASKNNNIGYQSGSFVGGAIVNNLNFQDYNLQPYSSPKEYHDALSKGDKNDGVAAIIDEIPYIKIFLGKYASHGYAMIASESSTNGFAFAFQKGSPLVSEMSRAIAKLRGEKRLIMIEERWFKKSYLISKDSQTNGPKVLNLNSFLGLFLITGISSALALLVHLSYKLHEKWGTRAYHLRILLMEKALFMTKYHFTNHNSNVNGGTLN